MDQFPPPEKHVAVAARRRRYDSSSKYGGRGGRTLFKARNPDSVHADGYTDVYLKITRPKDEDGNVLLTSLDQHLDDLPLDEGMGGHLFKLSEMLEEQCIEKKVGRADDLPDITVTTYTLQGVVWMTPNAEERERLQRKREARLSLAKDKYNDVDRESEELPDNYKVIYRFRDTPLVNIKDPSLLDYIAKVPSKARVFEQDFNHCFVSPMSEHEPKKNALEVDLGADCRVTFVSTQGQFPMIKRTIRETGLRIVRDELSCNWVTKYELSYRQNHGHEWIVAGASFEGNRDMLTEVAHKLDGPDGKGILCRYLRVLPLAFHGKPAMRVGVYGVRGGPAAEERRRDAQVKDESLVHYAVHCLKEGANKRQAPGGGPWEGLAAHCCLRKSCRCNRLRPAAVRRKRLAERTVQEVRRLTPQERGGLSTDGEDGDGSDGDGLAPVDEAAQEDRDDVGIDRDDKGGEGIRGEGGGADAGSSPALAQPAQPPSLRRSWSQLSAAAASTSSLGSSLLVVDGVVGSAGASGVVDEGDWVVF